MQLVTSEWQRSKGRSAEFLHVSESTLIENLPLSQSSQPSKAYIRSIYSLVSETEIPELPDQLSDGDTPLISQVLTVLHAPVESARTSVECLRVLCRLTVPHVGAHLDRERVNSICAELLATLPERLDGGVFLETIPVTNQVRFNPRKHALDVYQLVDSISAGLLSHVFSSFS